MVDERDTSSDKTQSSDQTNVSDKVTDRLQEAAQGAGAGSGVVQAAKNLTGNKLINDILQWQTQITALPSQTDPNGNVIAFNTKQWTDEHYQKADELHKQIPKRMKIYGTKAQLNQKELDQAKTMMELDDGQLST